MQNINFYLDETLKFDILIFKLVYEQYSQFKEI